MGKRYLLPKPSAQGEQIFYHEEHEDREGQEKKLFQNQILDLILRGLRDLRGSRPLWFPCFALLAPLR